MPHLKPTRGAILQFVPGPGLPDNVVGFRWFCWEVIMFRAPEEATTYRLRRVDAPGEYVQITQDVMDHCGRLESEAPHA